MADTRAAVGSEWALRILRASVNASASNGNSDPTIPSLLLVAPPQNPGSPDFPINDPEKLAYIRELIRYILEGRAIVAFYNVALLGIVLIVAICHLWKKAAQRRRWRAIEEDEVGDDDDPKVPADGSDDHASSSSSASSTLEGSVPSSQASGSITKFADDVDSERQPLLVNNRHHTSRRSRASACIALIRSWLLYQPPPIPILNRKPPSNGTSLLVAGYLGLNIFFHLYKMPFEAQYFFAFADRAGCVFVANLPLLYLLATKNQGTLLRTFMGGRSYEALNALHRRVGELMCFEAAVHFVGMLLWRLWLEPEWITLATGTLWEYLTHPLILFGFGAFVSYEALYFTSLAGFRERWYEVFLASHVTLQLAALTFLYLHFRTSRPYVLAALAIFVVDRLVWRAWLASVTVDADLRVLEDGDTVMLSADWDILPSSPEQEEEKKGGSVLAFLFSWSRSRNRNRNILSGWRPADHVFISVPALGGSHALQAHPFTIASAAPRSIIETESETETLPGGGAGGGRRGGTHAWFNLLIRAQTGFTRALLAHAHTHEHTHTPRRVPVRIDGPYGSSSALDALRACRTAVLIAGGSGIAVAFPLIWDLAVAQRKKTTGEGGRRRRRRKLHLLWVIHSAAQRSWISESMLDELRTAGVDVCIPLPTEEVGRPDLRAYVEDVVMMTAGDVDEDGGKEVGVLVSGPDGMNRCVRNACAGLVRSGGVHIDLLVEKFGW